MLGTVEQQKHFSAASVCAHNFQCTSCSEILHLEARAREPAFGSILGLKKEKNKKKEGGSDSASRSAGLKPWQTLVVSTSLAPWPFFFSFFLCHCFKCSVAFQTERASVSKLLYWGSEREPGLEIEPDDSETFTSFCHRPLSNS